VTISYPAHVCRKDTACGLRIELQLQPKFSGGVLEWKVR